MSIGSFVRFHGLEQWEGALLDVADDVQELVEGLCDEDFDQFVEDNAMGRGEAAKLKAALINPKVT